MTAEQLYYEIHMVHHLFIKPALDIRTVGLFDWPNTNLSYIYLGSSVCHPVCRPVVVAER
jgi:hypothetical protein